MAFDDTPGTNRVIDNGSSQQISSTKNGGQMNRPQPTQPPSAVFLPAALQPNATLPAWTEFAGKWGKLPGATKPTAEDRQAVSNYCRQVADNLRSSPVENDNKLRSIAKLYALLAVDGGQSDDLLDARNIVYLEALSGYPGWAVERAVKWWIAGEHPAAGERRQFVPKPCDLIRLIKIAMYPVEREQERAGRVLLAIDNAANETPEPTPEERESIGKRMEALAASFRLKAMNEAAFDAVPNAEPPRNG